MTQNFHTLLISPLRSSNLSTPVLLKLLCASKSPEGLVKTHNNGLYDSFWFRGSDIGLEICTCNKWWWCCWSRNHTLRIIILPLWVFFLSSRPGAQRKQVSFYSRYTLACVLPHDPCSPHPLCTGNRWAHLSLSSEFAVAQPLPSHNLLATLKLLSPPTHVAFCLLLFSHSLCFFASISVCQILTSRLPLASIHRPQVSNCKDIYICKAQCVFMIPPTSVKQGFSSQIYSQLNYVEGEGWTLYWLE